MSTRTTPGFRSVRPAGLWGLLLAIDPLDRMAAQVGLYRFAERHVKRVGAEAREEFKTFQLVLDRILHLREAQLDALGAQTVVEFRDDVRGGDVDACHRLSRDHDPAHGRGRTRYRVEHTVAE